MRKAIRYLQTSVAAKLAALILKLNVYVHNYSNELSLRIPKHYQFGWALQFKARLTQK